MANVLVTDGLLRKSLAATRSLGQLGLVVHTADKTRCTPSAFSKHSRKALLSPDSVTETERYADWLLHTLRTGGYQVLFPMDDGALDAVYAHHGEVDSLCACPLPPERAYRIASDKWETVQLAQQAGVPVPDAWCPESREELAALVSDLTYPVVVKPRRSSGSRGIRIAKDRDELLRLYAEAVQTYPQPMIQACIPLGDRFDVCLLYNRDGEVRASFVQREVRHFPLPIGPSTVQESVHLPELIEQTTRLLETLSWHGVVEIEYMRDPRDGVYKLMEINPRFWNSLALAVQSGVDFPQLLYQVAMTGDAEPVHAYEVGRLCRNLLPGDLLHCLSNPQRREMAPPLFAKGGLKVSDDILSREDPLAAVGFAAGCLRYLFDRRLWRMMFRR
ncbi:MAG TPA: ATP-grasp domain-containing protein [Bacilli bacterium]|nr:ATP-grasp domain-containing protein [Bacilli bacterium]